MAAIRPKVDKHRSGPLGKRPESPPFLSDTTADTQHPDARMFQPVVCFILFFLLFFGKIGNIRLASCLRPGGCNRNLVHPIKRPKIARSGLLAQGK